MYHSSAVQVESTGMATAVAGGGGGVITVLL